MAKTKAKKASTKKITPRADSKAKTSEEIQKVRNSVTNMILNSSEEMAARVVQSVTEGGQVAALKYLWEMAGMFPFEAGEWRARFSGQDPAGANGVAGESPGDRWGRRG